MIPGDAQAVHKWVVLGGVVNVASVGRKVSSRHYISGIREANYYCAINLLVLNG